MYVHYLTQQFVCTNPYSHVAVHSILFARKALNINRLTVNGYIIKRLDSLSGPSALMKHIVIQCKTKICLYRYHHVLKRC